MGMAIPRIRQSFRTLIPLNRRCIFVKLCAPGNSGSYCLIFIMSVPTKQLSRKVNAVPERYSRIFINFKSGDLNCPQRSAETCALASVPLSNATNGDISSPSIHVVAAVESGCELSN
ncbi:hypothetical protein FRC03_001894 [Tulasnella sp. 419]|nr:hypothetical protein FRC03_001894 [Tulasnella sp. 419]